ncbi:unnamed protein product [Lupinus luteus]|uniref:RNA recognition motif domain-containing protein n=1 Tax=Lupinus luteus TaxID=3873 RepID=A0AAV1Y546_LUPLU
MDMAEKGDTEGRCPACRSAYDKEKIVGMASNCERLVNGISVEKKTKNQKAKSKSSDGRKQLSSVRVIQRNLVYIVGLSLTLGDEDLLQQQEYFGQYGNVLKVSMSRTASGVIQQFPNDTCSVYITYSKEYEAILCIQNVHGFILEGKPLRACFGTTKYCHAWLRNVPCNNPNCLYLHEIGSQEDSFSKDEVISAYTRNRVQQVTGATINMQRRSGNVLPPPMDDSVNNFSGKPIMESAASNSVSTVRESPSNGMNGKPVTLPASAAWGMQATNCQSPAGVISYPNEQFKPKSDTISSRLDFSSAVAGTIQAPALHSDVTKREHSGDGNPSMMPRVKNELLKPGKHYDSMDTLVSAGDKTSASDDSHVPVNLNGKLSSILSPQDSDRGSCTTANTVNSPDLTGKSHSSDPEEGITITNEEIRLLSREFSSINIDRNALNELCCISNPSSPPPGDVLIKPHQIQGLQYSADQFRDVVITDGAVKAATSDNGVRCSREQSEWRLDSQSEVLSNTLEVEDDVTSFDNQRLKDPEVFSHSYFPDSTSFLHASNHSTPRILQHAEPFTVVNAGSLYADDRVGDESLSHPSTLLCNGYPEKLVSGSIARLVSEVGNAGHDAAMDKGENCIISNILSMDFDAWDDSLTSPYNLAKLLGDNTDNQSGPLKKSSSWKVQSNNHSRFSFARQEEPKIQNFDVYPSHTVSHQQPKCSSFIQDFAERDSCMDKLGIANVFPTSKFEEAENISSGHFVASSHKLSAISRAQVSAPPGFSVPSRPPPPGFSSHERVEQTFVSVSGNSVLDHSPLRNSYHIPSAGNIGSIGDVEFMDPAILAVGKGRYQGALNSPAMDMRSNFMPPLNYLENEARLQLLMERSLSSQQNLRYPEIGNTFPQLSDSYGISSRFDQQVNNMTPFPQMSLQQSTNAVLSNGQWDGWSEVQSGNSLEVAEILRNGRLGFNNFFSAHDDSKYRMPNSGDLYRRKFGM